MERQRFTGAEDVALVELLDGQKKRIDWCKVAKELHERGFPKRTTKSVRNHHLRRKNAQNGTRGPNKNRCRICGKMQKGHVCEIIDTAPPPAEVTAKA